MSDPFEAERPRLKRLAYRMLGSLSDAEDVVQDAWLRWRRAVPETIADPPAWLVRTTTRLCIDELRAARVRREAYRGPWLPEPLIEASGEDSLERAQEVSIAFLLALERLSPLERAALLLHDVFDADYPEIAGALQRSEAACRKLLSRARAHVRETRVRHSPSKAEVERLVGAFQDAVQFNDLKPLADLLTEDAILISDGGGKGTAALRPLVGREDILQLIRGLLWRKASAPGEVRIVRINGAFGLLFTDATGPTICTLDLTAEGRVAAVYLLSNPDKLRHVAVGRP